ncbi:MAG TPA: glycosyltransferase [Mucilaginibacter sp.]|nr:glycosyltransferase [Mucilaginibacter sp.]
MRIFLSFLQSKKNYPIPSYSFWQYYIKNGIEEAGYEWSECPGADWALGLVPQNAEDLLRWKQDTWGKTVAWLKKNPADIFLSYLYPSQVDLSAIREIQRMGIPCVNFFCDHVREFRTLPEEFGAFNNNWVPEYKAIKLYTDAGYPFINLPMPMWVEPKYRILREEVNQQITFIGSKDMQRVLLLERLVKQDPKIPLAIYGAGWNGESNGALPYENSPDYTLLKKIKFNKDFIRSQGIAPFIRKIKYRNLTYNTSPALSSRTHRSPDFETYNELIAGSMISLGINRYESFHYPLYKPNSYSRLRDIEAPMLGACYLTEYTEGLEELYDIENEIMAYLDAEDLFIKIQQLQADPAKRKSLKINGQKKALGKHNIPSSLNIILQRVMH